MNKEDFYRTVSQCLTVDYCNGWNDAVDRIFENDVQAIVHANKIIGGMRTTILSCSECWEELPPDCNYCPNCGAMFKKKGE